MAFRSQYAGKTVPGGRKHHYSSDDEVDYHPTHSGLSLPGYYGSNKRARHIELEDDDELLPHARVAHTQCQSGCLSDSENAETDREFSEDESCEEEQTKDNIEMDEPVKTSDHTESAHLPDLIAAGEVEDNTESIQTSPRMAAQSSNTSGTLSIPFHISSSVATALSEADAPPTQELPLRFLSDAESGQQSTSVVITAHSAPPQPTQPTPGEVVVALSTLSNTAGISGLPTKPKPSIQAPAVQNKNAWSDVSWDPQLPKKPAFMTSEHIVNGGTAQNRLPKALHLPAGLPTKPVTPAKSNQS
ncbi:hypothetical protein EJ08DRAFT_340835 [Tothia fuscella]|uniref:Uncharacterized protein n=1 Tax=Tothia fuscella TaxID=1048955 RepID=A0A9P4U3C9_9PEZI|nr:hypothetical protein EJ08DRAFT_340835 [Tothia fuscella]